jgi:hypothetical protein
MATYTSSKVLLPTGFDEIGLKLSLQRFEAEALDDYRRRLLLETAQPAGSSFSRFSASVSRKVGLFDTPVIRLDIVLDGDGEPLAADPVIVITASKLYAYQDYSAGTVEIELLLTDRDGEWFIQDVVDAFSGSTYFTCTLLDSAFAYKLSQQLAAGSNIKFKEVYRLSPREVHDFNVQNLREVLFSDPLLFKTEVATPGDIEEYGDYYLDRLQGAVQAYSSMGGGAVAEYVEFPFEVRYQSVRSYEFKDEDVNHIIYDNLLSTDGSESRLLLNSVGAKMVNEILAVHPLEWGE